MPFGLLDLSLILLLLHLLGVIAAVHAVLTVRTSQGAVAWCVALLTLPYVTLLPYLFLGRRRFADYVAARRFVVERMHEQAGRMGWRPLREMASDLIVNSEHACIRTLSRLAGSPTTGHNRVRLLVDGEATFAAILAAIAAAQRCVIVQFFIVHDDSVGRALQRALIERASEGVKVHFLYDSIGCHALPGRYIATLRKAGVDARAFAATRGMVNRFQVNFRNHRKLVIVDGERAFVGGHNVGDEYLGRRPPLSPWRDTHIELVGPVAAVLQLSFTEDWYAATQTLPTVLLPKKADGGAMLCQAIPSGPTDSLESGSLLFVEAINAARRRVWITSPYFVPDEAVSAALRLAVLRGVEVKVLLPSRPDHRVVFAASTLYAYEAARAGVQLFRYQPGFLHQKVLLIDDDIAIVGSANLDNRSFRLNFELMVATVDAGFAAEVEAMLADDFSHAVAIDPAVLSTLPPWRRVAMGLARLFAPIL
ncbi:cardiolipin synthase [Crenobacter cavernae]|uniref:Cardiolipin synthase A n=1 Tax=Crenobacter cavernae TaxID=2290923 RepID=A0A345Y5P8_9NEIS|nr:cardiolipin synthase [Crenobacter cavernae]AXK39250.1 cardiolipin synthase [Crenobacter cavernae]